MNSVHLVTQKKYRVEPDRKQAECTECIARSQPSSTPGRPPSAQAARLPCPARAAMLCCAPATTCPARPRAPSARTLVPSAPAACSLRARVPACAPVCLPARLRACLRACCHAQPSAPRTPSTCKKGVPRRGELKLSRRIALSGYSPPKCSAMFQIKHTFKQMHDPTSMSTLPTQIPSPHRLSHTRLSLL